MVLSRAYGKKLYLEFHKNQSWVDFCLTHFSAIFFLSIESKYFTYYADETTPYIIGNDSGEVVSEHKTVAEKLFT